MKYQENTSLHQHVEICALTPLHTTSKGCQESHLAFLDLFTQIFPAVIICSRFYFPMRPKHIYWFFVIFVISCLCTSASFISFRLLILVAQGIFSNLLKSHISDKSRDLFAYLQTVHDS